MNIRKIQGNSLWIKISCESYLDIDPTWANYSGTWSIISSTGVASGNGNLTTSSTTPGTFYLKVPTTVMAALTKGTYTLTSQIKNTSVDYEEERQDKLIVDKAELIV